MRPDVMFTQPLLFETLVSRGADAAAAWLLTYLVHSTVILLLAWIVTSSSRVTDTVRDVVWKFALVGGILTATVQTVAGPEPLGGQLRIAPRTAPQGPPMRIAMRETPAHETRRFILTSSRGTRWSAALVVMWFTTSGLALLWLTFRHGHTLRALGDRTPLDGTPARARLDDLLVRAGVTFPVTLTCSSAIASPVALSGNEVCLPRRALFELTPNELEGMLAHEVAHLVRRDPQWLVVARAIETVLFLQPLNRLARRRIQEVAEFLCDDWAVSRVSHPVTLAKCLAAVAEWVGRAPRIHTQRLQPLSAMVESDGSPLVRRVGRILSGRPSPRPRTPRFTFAASAGALIALVAIAPRISVAHPAPPDGVMAFFRATATVDRRPARDSVFVIRARATGRIRMDSLVRQAHQARQAGAAAGVLTRVRRTGTATVSTGAAPNVILVEQIRER